ncbi:MAG: metallophosphoesterase, partial [Candidatus Hydrogenedentota bacterium]
VLAANEYLLVPPAIEPFARVVGRPVTMLTAPAWKVSDILAPHRPHHWDIINFAIAAYGTALGAAACIAYWRVRRISPTPPPADVAPITSRRQFLKYSAGAGLIFVPGSVGTYSTVIEPGELVLRRYTAPIRDLPASFEGLSIAQVSDTHYGPYVSLRYLEHMVERVNNLRPDLVALTGDYVLHSPRAIDGGVQVLSKLRARLGIAGVLGNHDHWEGADEIRERFASIGVPLIDNSRLFLTESGLVSDPSGNAIAIAGLGDLWEDRVSFASALDGLPPDMPRVLLSHNPDTAEAREGANHRVDLMLSGHTHGGQVSVPGHGAILLPSAYGRKYEGGWCEGPHFPAIVSRGVGMAFLPIRFRVPPEIVLVTLRRTVENA